MHAFKKIAFWLFPKLPKHGCCNLMGEGYSKIQRRTNGCHADIEVEDQQDNKERTGGKKKCTS